MDAELFYKRQLLDLNNDYVEEEEDRIDMELDGIDVPT